MARKSDMDMAGAVALTGFALLLAFNQVVIKVVNDGIQPVFFAGIRSLGGAVLIYLWMRFRNIPIAFPRHSWGPGLLIGLCFAVEFMCLFWALDLTSVTRTSIIFYSMPIWLAIAAHFLLPGERLTPLKVVGLAVAFAGVVIALLARRDPSEETSLQGDLLALLAAMSWAGLALCVRATRLSEERPEAQLLWQLIVSAPILLMLAPLFGPVLRAPELIHWAGLGFQVVIVVSAGFLFWFWLLSIYPAGSVAAFSFLSPVFGVGLGWYLLDESIGLDAAIALLCVCVGLVLINRRPKQPATIAASG